MLCALQLEAHIVASCSKLLASLLRCHSWFAEPWTIGRSGTVRSPAHVCGVELAKVYRSVVRSADPCPMLQCAAFCCAPVLQRLLYLLFS
jgi:hypothetical protein